MFADYHIHTEFSDDSVYPMEEVVKDAIKLGMDEICFTDHVDYGSRRTGTAAGKLNTAGTSRTPMWIIPDIWIPSNG